MTEDELLNEAAAAWAWQHYIAGHSYCVDVDDEENRTITAIGCDCGSRWSREDATTNAVPDSTTP